MQLTKHFSLNEMISSPTARGRGIVNLPSDEEARNLLKLAVTILEPARLLLNTPMKVNSGFRCGELNAAVGGVHNSQHMQGLACDFVVPETDINLAFDLLAHSDLPFDQLLRERTNKGAEWIHISAAPGDDPRREVKSIIHRPHRRAIS